MEEKNFATAIRGFYSKFLKAISDTVIILADIEDEYKEDYQKLKEIQKDPTLILERLNELNEKDKEKLLAMFVRISKLESRMVKLFDLDSKEKRELAKELNEFISTINEK